MSTKIYNGYKLNLKNNSFGAVFSWANKIFMPYVRNNAIHLYKQDAVTSIIQEADYAILRNRKADIYIILLSAKTLDRMLLRMIGLDLNSIMVVEFHCLNTKNKSI